MSGKIAFFLPDLSGGGAERVMLNLAKEISYSGFRVDLVLIRKEGAYLNDARGKVNIVGLESRRALFAFAPFIRYLNREKPEIVLSCLFAANFITISAKYALRRKFKPIIRVAVYFSSPVKTFRGILQKFVSRFLLYPSADCLIAISKGMREDLQRVLKIPPERIRLAYNPVNTAEISAKKEEPCGHGWFSEGADYRVVLSAGRLTYQKNFDTLIKAFASLQKSCPRARLMILGEGRNRRELEDMGKELNLSDRICFPGFVGNPYSYMGKSCVFVLSSRREGFANVILESLACGTPVVSTDCPSGPSEILDGGKYGKLVPVGDAEAMAEAILEVLENPPPPELLEKRAEDFSVKKIADEYLEAMFSGKPGAGA